MSTTRLYRGAELSEEDFPVDGLRARLAAGDAIAWVDIDHHDDAALAAVGTELGLHQLAVEDAEQRHQRPKLDQYRTHQFLAVYGTTVADDGSLTTCELSIFVTDRALVTVHDGFDMTPVTRRWDDSVVACDRVGALLHALLDVVVDGHLGAVSTLDDRIEDLEGLVFEDTPDVRRLQRDAVLLRRSLSRLRRVVLPMREIMTGLTRVAGLVDEELDPYFGDIRDHVVHATEWTESLRDHVTALRETQLTIQGNRLNLVMKKVTGWAAIIAVPTAITGFYGQNVPYPGNGEPWGFWVSTTVILGLGIWLYAMFKRKDWL
ncbi:magnesium transporter CorA family protein [Actinokineospora globicatena]|uniref:Magnesium transporter CorA n=1 Tax=Actinokineospora globicatena TaxID=103729 RepID=A0A9W6QRG8_9PSEU|nr:magnesium transporter CorA family protein [Actinokineospora globicatena]GLW95213.1 magnesium transporter CorA [Actinokineospora globicatena]